MKKIIMLACILALNVGCSDSERISKFLNETASNHPNAKINFKLEVGPWGNKATWEFVGIEDKNNVEVEKE